MGRTVHEMLGGAVAGGQSDRVSERASSGTFRIE